MARRILRLNCGPYAFGGIHPDWKNRKVVFGWVAETEFENIALIMIVVWNLPPKWPPFKSSSCFTEPPSTAQQPLFRKKDERGLLERRQVLRGVCSFADDFVDHALEKNQGKATEDDILDALVAAVTASKSIHGLSFIPDPPEIDSTGLPMQMAYCVLPTPIPFPKS